MSQTKKEKKQAKEEEKALQTSLEIMTQSNIEKINDCDFSSYLSTAPYITKCGITFYNIGNTKGLFLTKNGYPRCIIGPHWYFYFIMLTIISLLVSFLYGKFLALVLNFPMKILFYFLLAVIVGIYSVNVLINPGLAMNQVRNELDEQYCTICQTYIKKNSNTFHCNFCNVCIEGFDHHCVWIGKCVGNKNKIWFYAMIGSVAVIYVFIIIAFIYFYIHYKK